MASRVDLCKVSRPLGLVFRPMAPKSAGFQRPWDHWLGPGLTPVFAATDPPPPLAPRPDAPMAEAPTPPEPQRESATAENTTAATSARSSSTWLVRALFLWPAHYAPSLPPAPPVDTCTAPDAHFKALSLQSAYLHNESVRPLSCGSGRRFSRERRHVPHRRLRVAMRDHARVRSFALIKCVLVFCELILVAHQMRCDLVVRTCSTGGGIQVAADDVAPSLAPLKCHHP